jgi:hypothetical protein
MNSRRFIQDSAGLTETQRSTAVEIPPAPHLYESEQQSFKIRFRMNLKVILGYKSVIQYDPKSFNRLGNIHHNTLYIPLLFSGVTKIVPSTFNAQPKTL